MAQRTDDDRRAHEVRPATRYALLSGAGLAVVLASATTAGVLLALVASQWPPLQGVDQAVVDAANSAVSERPLVVTGLTLLTWLGGSPALTAVVSVLVVGLLVRRLWRLAVYAAVTGLGAAVLSSGTKALVERVRPAVDLPVSEAPGYSFPSGHSLGSAVTYGVVVLVLLPLVPQRRRPLVIGLAALLVVLIGATRVALGVHYPSDVVGGWAAGVVWLAVTALAFRDWRHHEGLGARDDDGLTTSPDERAALDPAPAHDRPVPSGARGAAVLLVTAVALWGAMAVLGTVLTRVTGLRAAEAELVAALADARSPAVTDVVATLGRLGDTGAVVAVLAVTAPLAVVLTRRWAPAVVLLLAVVGESLVFVAVSTVVERSRPDVEQVPAELPTTSYAFPSGHVAAAVALYGTLALLVLVWVRHPLRRAGAGVLCLVVVAVCVSRVYEGVHFPTDVAGGLVLGGVWVAVCWSVVRPARGAPYARASAA
ncbi:phosphatase PAP2 family protein [Aquipuribacter nitratireducens]|uniref:Phosphatase PAP2 family protein n=1 Tax=Aquipuribacter nitratireducens TaxID=650104 RepID=A0ABW0GLZ3_9MICO